MDPRQPLTPRPASEGVLAQRAATPARWRWRLPRQSIGYLFIAPAIIFLLLVVAYPIFTTVRMSVFERNYREKTTTFVGFDHYEKALEDKVFWDSLQNTVTYTAGSVVFHVLIGGFFALLLNESWGSGTFRNLMRGLLILPWLFSMAASALIWSLLYQAISPLNYLITESGLSSEPIAFVGDPNIALWSLVAVNVWKYFPFYMIMILGGLQSIPPELYDAAHVDGAGRLQRFRFITMPLLRPVLISLITIDFITTFGVFDIVKLMTNGGPFRATQTAAFYVWQKGLRDVNFGYGSAMSVIMLIIVGAFTLVYLRVTQKQAVYGDKSTAI